MRQKAPTQRLALGMQSNLQNAVAALHPYGLVFVGVVVERAHYSLPRPGKEATDAGARTSLPVREELHYLFRNLSSVTISAACRGAVAGSLAGAFAGSAGVSACFAAATSACRASITGGSATLATA